MLNSKAAPESSIDTQKAVKYATGALDVTNKWAARARGEGVGGEVSPLKPGVRGCYGTQLSLKRLHALRTDASADYFWFRGAYDHLNATLRYTQLLR